MIYWRNEMRNSYVSRLRRALMLMCASAVALVPLAPAVTASDDKMKAEEVIAKHLEAMGPAAARASEHSRVAVGSVKATFKVRSTSGVLDGRAVFGSVDRKVVFGLAFNAPNYPGEKLGFDGKKFTVGYLTPGVRSSLGIFLLSHPVLFKEGVMAGTLSAAWPLLNLAERNARVDYAGTDKIDGQLVHKLKYYPKGGSDVAITMYFDATTFYHVRTQYELRISSRIASGGVDAQARQQETRYKMVENFGDYKKEGELNLPHTYSLQFEVVKTDGSSLDKWEVALEQFAFNQPLEDSSFDVDGK